MKACLLSKMIWSFRVKIEIFHCSVMVLKELCTPAVRKSGLKFNELMAIRKKPGLKKALNC